METTRKFRLKLITLRKLMRPWCTGSKFGGHTMIEYRDSGTKVCIDCQYEELIYSEIK